MSLPSRYFVALLVCFASIQALSNTVVARQILGQRLLSRFQGPAPVESANFIVYADDRIMAAKVSQAAEGFRKALAADWLGKELPAWPQKCPIQVKIAPHAGGETSFAFQMDHTNRGVPVDWEMKIYGSPERILDAVLPHEITHTIFATHFGRPLPRWADEGACTTVEHVSERNKNHRMLLEFLTTSRGIPFNRMFTMKQYPSDILPLYAQGHSVAKYLIFQKGKRHFLNYIDRGMQYEEQGGGIASWNQATSEFYGFEDLSDLQLSWVAWVRDGSKETAAAELAKSTQAKLSAKISPPQQTFTNAAPQTLASNTNQVRSLLDPATAKVSFASPKNDTAKVAFANQKDSWYASQMQVDATARAAQRAKTTIQARKASATVSQAEPQEQVAPVQDSRLTSPTDLILR